MRHAKTLLLFLILAAISLAAPADYTLSNRSTTEAIFTFRDAGSDPVAVVCLPPLSCHSVVVTTALGSVIVETGSGTTTLSTPGYDVASVIVDPTGLPSLVGAVTRTLLPDLFQASVAFLGLGASLYICAYWPRKLWRIFTGFSGPETT